MSCKMNMRSIANHKIFKNGIWLMLMQIFNTIVPLVTVPFVTRALTPEGYGQFSSALNLILYCQVVVEYGFQLSGTRRIAISKDFQEIEHTYNLILFSRLFLLLISAAAMGILSFGFSTDKVFRRCMVLLFTMVMGTALQAVWFFQGMENMRPITLVSVAARSISVVCIFLTLHSRNALYWYCLFYAITHFIAGLSHLIVAVKKYGIHIHPPKPREVFAMLAENRTLFFSCAVSSLFSGFGTTLLTLFSSSFFVGVYAAIHKIPYILSMFYTPVSQAMYPHVNKLAHSAPGECFAFVKKLALPIVGLFALASGFIILLRGPVTAIGFGEDYAGYANVAIPLLMQMLFGIMNNFLGIQLLVSLGYEKYYSRSFILSMILFVTGSFLSALLVTEAQIIWVVSICTMAAEGLLTMMLFYKVRQVSKALRGKESEP